MTFLIPLLVKCKGIRVSAERQSREMVRVQGSLRFVLMVGMKAFPWWSICQVLLNAWESLFLTSTARVHHHPWAMVFILDMRICATPKCGLGWITGLVNLFLLPHGYQISIRKPSPRVAFWGEIITPWMWEAQMHLRSTAEANMP